MSSNLVVAIILQGLVVIWLFMSVRVRKADYHFFDMESTIALKGWFSIIIVLFHVPVSNILCNLLGNVLFVTIVTMFSFFSSYGMTIKTRENMDYLDTIPIRFVKIVVLYGVTLLLKGMITENMFSGGILWINTLLLSYAVFFVVHLIFRGGGIATI